MVVNADVDEIPANDEPLNTSNSAKDEGRKVAR
jgi:hypothetical protein